MVVAINADHITDLLQGDKWELIDVPDVVYEEVFQPAGEWLADVAPHLTLADCYEAAEQSLQSGS